MKETTCQKLQEIGAFALAGGCNGKRMTQLVEMIRAARGYRWVGVYKIIKDEFVIRAETGNEPRDVSALPCFAGAMRRSVGLGQTDYCRRCAQRSALSAYISYYAFRDRCPDEERPPSHSRHPGCGERQAERVWRRRSTISGARRRFDRPLSALKMRGTDILSVWQVGVSPSKAG